MAGRLRAQWEKGLWDPTLHHLKREREPVMAGACRGEAECPRGNAGTDKKGNRRWGLGEMAVWTRIKGLVAEWM